MDQNTVILIIVLSMVVIMVAIVALVVGYKLSLDYLKSSRNESLENSEEDVNLIIAHVIDKELDRRLEELGLIPSEDLHEDFLKENSEHSEDDFKKMLRDMDKSYRR